MASVQQDGVTFGDWMQATQSGVEGRLDQFLPAVQTPCRISCTRPCATRSWAAAKRVRPLLVMAAGELFDADQDTLARAACALEMIHVYSLVHDDMPCMDDDALRRGKPTVHIAYDEATPCWSVTRCNRRRSCCCRRRGDSSGAANGDDQAAGARFRLKRHVRRPGDRSRQRRPGLEPAAAGTDASTENGRLAARGRDSGRAGGQGSGADDDGAERLCACAVGLAFQVVDDVLDATADSATLGKTAGKDAAANKQADLRIDTGAGTIESPGRTIAVRRPCGAGAIREQGTPSARAGRPWSCSGRHK